ncbi:CS1 type fimbrial major subunit [Stenotrophomonas sp.]|uniref:CS1 type fimbrial major subunit n=1 Tax=Stenotrophomonas sp. TaxID=69392 RepID=UPI0028A9A5B6|nr:CS1 type fimbrial major subunit [Stenotrophomonas sp.]
MRINTTTLSLVATMIMAPSAAIAAPEQFPLQVTVEAIVPSATGLQISPVGDWAGQVQAMRWDIAAQRLDPIQQQLDMKSGLGAINAYLSTDAMLVSAGDSIDMTVTVAGQALEVGAANAVEVASAIEASASKRAAVVIAAAAPAGAEYAQGNYQGNVFMMFESGTP